MNLEQRKALFDAVPTDAHLNTASSGQIIFVGSDQRFSDAFLRTVQFEIPSLKAVRVDALGMLNDKEHLPSDRVWLIILDSRLLRDVTDIAGFVDKLRDDMQSADVPAPQIAIACETDSCRSLDRDGAIQLLKDHRSVEGFRGVLPLSRPVDVWLEILRLFLSRGSYYPPELFSSLLSEDTSRTRAHNSSGRPQSHMRGMGETRHLTRRETQVLSLVAEGLQNKQIAADLSLSEHTVKLHIHNVISKLEVKNRTEAAAWFLSSHRKL